jgi:hypothetical protein
MTITMARPALAPGETRSSLIDLQEVEKVYRTGTLTHPALRGVDLSIAAGELVALAGQVRLKPGDAIRYA